MLHKRRLTRLKYLKRFMNRLQSYKFFLVLIKTWNLIIVRTAIEKKKKKTISTFNQSELRFWQHGEIKHYLSPNKFELIRVSETRMFLCFFSETEPSSTKPEFKMASYCTEFPTRALKFSLFIHRHTFVYFREHATSSVSFSFRPALRFLFTGLVLGLSWDLSHLSERWAEPHEPSVGFPSSRCDGLSGMSLCVLVSL